MIYTRRRGITAIVLWLIFLLACAGIISRTHFTTDLSAFLPRSPTPEQQLLMDQLSDGLASRLILVGIEGANAPTRAWLSRQVAQRLRAGKVVRKGPGGEQYDRHHTCDHG
jgi:predicted exporter